MTVKSDKLIKDIEHLGLKLPQHGSGRHGRILNSDLQAVLANHFFAEHSRSHGFGMRMCLNEVMLAYRGDTLSEKEREEVFANGSSWIAEEKFNGCRALVTFFPNEGFRVFGRNRSKFNYLPIEYTRKIYVKHLKCTIDEIKLPYFYDKPFLLDCELIVSGNIQTLSGVYTEKGVNTATALLNTDIDVSLTHQKTGAEFTCVLFDMLGTLNPDIFKSELDCEQPFHQRRAALERFCSTAWFKDNLAPFMQISEAHYSGKDAFLKAVIAQGKEGVILKNLRAPYIRGLNGFRPKTATLKFKRSVAGSLGSDIDCYIIGFVTSEYYDSRNWIAGIKLAVKLRDDNGNLREHWLATVTSMADEMRERLTYVHQDGRIDLWADYLGQVLVIDGQDISARNRRIAHAKVRWDIGFRPDKGPEDCILDESFIESQVF